MRFAWLYEHASRTFRRVMVREDGRVVMWPFPRENFESNVEKHFVSGSEREVA